MVTQEVHDRLFREQLTGGDLPPEASGRLSRATFSSGLSVADFAACLDLGLRPVGLVQGFCAMRWSWYSTRSRYGRPGLTGRSRWGSTIRTYPCRHVTPDIGHRTWGENFEQPWVSDAWMNGFSAAQRRMLEEAAAAGAHGVIGVVDTTSHLVDNAILEFHLYGTAVVLEETGAPENIWSTYLAGQA